MPKLESEVMVQRGALITISTNSRANVVLRHQSDACGERAAARVCSPLSLSNRPDSQPSKVHATAAYTEYIYTSSYMMIIAGTSYSGVKILLLDTIS